jgi:hypothetical protein
VAPVERVVDDDLPSREILDVGPADASVLDLLVPDPVLGRHDVVGGRRHGMAIGRLGLDLKDRPDTGCAFAVTERFEPVAWGKYSSDDDQPHA